MVRVKYRYLLSEIVPLEAKHQILGSEFALKDKDIASSIMKTVERIYGDHGIGCIRDRLSVRMYNPVTRVFIIRVRRGAHVLVTSSMPFITKIRGTGVSLKMLYLGGTIRSCMKFLLRYDIKMMDIFLKVYRNEEQRRKIQQIMHDCRKHLSGDGPPDEIMKTER